MSQWYQWFMPAPMMTMPALGLVGVVGELARHGDHMLARHAGDALLPGRGVGRIGVVAAVQGLAVQAARDAVVAGQQVEHRGHGHAALGVPAVQIQVGDGHAAQHHVTTLVVGLEMRRLHATEVGKATSATACAWAPSSSTEA